MKNIELKNIEHPLRWPEGYARTRIQDRKGNAGWKKRTLEYQALLEKELKKFGATDWIITANADDRDPGVAVYFSLKPLDQYGWQEALGFIGHIPTIEQIEVAYRDRALKIHPDRPGGDAKLFAALTEHRDRAKAWARGEQTIEHDKVFAVDAFSEVRLNLNAIRLVVGALRQIERCGAPVMMERALRGFHKSLTVGGVDVKQAVNA
jgi:hypothetical protein